MNSPDISELDEMTRHRLLADDQRRFVIASLRAAPCGDETTLDELATALDRMARREAVPDAGYRQNLRCRLHHVHLPMLDDAGVIDYDSRTKQIRLGAQGTATALAESL